MTPWVHFDEEENTIDFDFFLFFSGMQQFNDNDNSLVGDNLIH